jgi:hypothetical protein
VRTRHSRRSRASPFLELLATGCVHRIEIHALHFALIAAVVPNALAARYLRIVLGARVARFTALTVAISAPLMRSVLMQTTARIEWNASFAACASTSTTFIASAASMLPSSDERRREAPSMPATILPSPDEGCGAKRIEPRRCPIFEKNSVASIVERCYIRIARCIGALRQGDIMAAKKKSAKKGKKKR